jgi:hypothetical protein
MKMKLEQWKEKCKTILAALKSGFKELLPWQKVLVYIATGILVCVIIGSVALVALRVNGKHSLYGKADSDKPDLSSSQQIAGDRELEINPDDMEEISSMEGDTETDAETGQETESADETTELAAAGS